MSRFNVGGTSQWLYQLSRGLDERGITNLLLVGNCSKGEQEDRRLSKLNHKRIPGLGPGTSPIKTLSAFFALRREIKKIDPDIINTHTSKAGVLGRLAAKTTRSRPKVIHTYHGHVLHGYFNPFTEYLIRSIEIFLGLFTDLFLVSGERVLAELKCARIIRNKPTRTIWPAVPEIKPGNRLSLRESLGISGEAIVFGWLGRKVPIKRIDRILDLAKARPDYNFVLAGDGESIKKTYPDYFGSGEVPNLKELGYTSPSDLWAIADVCLLTSDNEAMPISPIEASLCSRPVIATDAGSTSEVVIHGQTGFIAFKDSTELLEFVDRLAQSKSLREKMGQAAHKFARSKFSPHLSIDYQVDSYKSLLTNKF